MTSPSLQEKSRSDQIRYREAFVLMRLPIPFIATSDAT